jgi:ABC-type transport system involved in resistance to organic solvents, periplasmic component
MESPQASTQLKVGIFLTVGIVTILLSIFFLGADKALFTKYTRLHAHFDQVQGLASGSVVSLSGVVAGNVEEIKFIEEKNALDVVMRIDSKFLPRIREGSQVEIRTQGALGDKFVFIIPGNPMSNPVREGSILEVAPATDIFGVLSERGSETSKIFDIIDELHKMVKTINSGNRMQHMFENLDSASQKLSQASLNADKFLTSMNGKDGGEKMRQSIERLNSILTKIDRGDGTLGALINDPSLHNQLKGLMGGGSKRDSHIKSLMRTSIEKADN